jgi:hypothetical protein
MDTDVDIGVDVADVATGGMTRHILAFAAPEKARLRKFDGTAQARFTARALI